MHNAARAYIRTQVTTTSQADILVLLYAGALNYLRQARERIEQKDVAGKGVLLSKALDVINELQSSLNKEKGGELAENLSKLYFYCNARLLLANLRMDTTPLDEVIRILEGLHSAYRQIVAGGAQTDAQDSEPRTVSGPTGPMSTAASATAAATAPAPAAPKAPTALKAPKPDVQDEEPESEPAQPRKVASLTRRAMGAYLGS